MHAIRYGDPEKDWGFNGDLEFPTFTPSVLVTIHWGNGKPREDPEFEETEKRCHSFVTDGMIQFLSDCTHPLAGQTVNLPEWPNGNSEE
jgi:hypothetical protein